MRTPIMIKLSDYKINLSLLSTFAIFVLRTCLLAGWGHSPMCRGAVMQESMT